ncbi:MAG: hypothetical protein IPJ30_21445 [Acidobacteria bacterium]|nr:hypothetical protein [Acidobacteriota bacterium]
MSRPLMVSMAQEKTSEPYSEASSLSEALRTGIPEAVKSIAVPTDAIVSNPNVPGEVCGWTAATNYPVPILDQPTVSQGGFLYTFGGVSTAIIADARRFDGTTWTSIAPLPAALEFPTAVSDGTFIYILGGALTGTGTPQTTMFRYDPSLNTYTTMAPFTVGTWNSAAVYVGGKIYKFAGTGPATASTDALEIYDVAGNTWSLGAVYPQQVSFVSAFSNGGFVYGAGGIASVGSVASLKTYRYDPMANTWDDAAIADLPLTRWGAASSGVLYGAGANAGWVLAGGYENGTATANISTSVIRWNPTTNTWTSQTSMTAERARMTGAVLGGSFYVIGGRSLASSGFVGTNSNQKLTCIENVAVINQGAVSLVSESFPPGNTSPDPGESITVSLPLTNTGDIPTTALTATLQATGGVTSPSAAQNYGAVAPDGMPVSRNFTFRVDPLLACGATITLTWTVADGATNYANATKIYVTGARTVTLTENFDGVTAPALPAGWLNTQTSGTGINWTTTTTTPNSGLNAAFASDPATANAAALSTPAVMITSTDSLLTFKNKYITESTFDGTVLEFSTDGGTIWTDVITGGGTFASGGYNGLISTSFSNPIGGRNAWTGTSAGGYIDTVVNLPASLNGQSVKFRWLTGSDSSVAATGQWVDDVQVFGARVCNAAAPNARADFDGDGKTDLSVFRPSEGNWYLQRSTAGLSVIRFGISSDVLTPGDYDGDGKADTAVFRPDANSANPDFWVLNSNGFTISGVSWGVANDIPINGDYDGDGKTDFAVFRPSTGIWYVLNSSNGANTIAPFGVTGDVPMAFDLENDGKTNLAVYRPSDKTWYIARNTGVPAQNFEAIPFGLANDLLVPADYDGDSKDDVAIFRPSTGEWFVRQSSDGATTITKFGANGDVPVPGDYDGDGKDDRAVYRNGVWWALRSTAGLSIQNFGVGTDIPIPVRYLPVSVGGM